MARGRKNSIEAHKLLDLSTRKRAVLDALRQVGHPMSDRQIKHFLQLEEKNSVSPTITDLLNDGALYDTGNDILCEVMGTMVRTVWLAKEPWIPVNRLVLSADVYLPVDHAVIPQSELTRLAENLGQWLQEKLGIANIEITGTRQVGSDSDKNTLFLSIKLPPRAYVPEPMTETPCPCPPTSKT